MKILMVNKFLYPNGGSETYMMKLGDYFKSMGHEVEYFGMEHPDRCVGNGLGLYTENMDFHNSGALRKIALSLKTIYSAEARKKLFELMEHFRPDAVHLNNFNFQLTPSVIYAVKDYDKKHGTHTTLVYTAHDSQLVCPNHLLTKPSDMSNCTECLGGKYINCIKNKCIHSSTLKSVLGAAEAVKYNSNKIYSRIDTIICCSEFMKSILDTNPVLREKTVALHNFIDTAYKEGDKSGDYVLYFGRFSYEKGINTLLNAKDINIVCAGSGALEEEINAAAHLTNVGFKSGDELHGLISGALCTVFPSICYENCPFSVMESISLGTPVVASSIGGVPELIDDGVTGILVEPGEPEKLSQAVESLLADREKAAQMSKACLEKHFDSLGEYAEKLLKIYANKE